MQQAVLLGRRLQMEGERGCSSCYSNSLVCPPSCLGAVFPVSPPTTRLWAACLERAVHQLPLGCAAGAHMVVVGPWQ